VRSYFVVLYRTKYERTLPATLLPARGPTEGARKRGLQGIFVTDPTEVWNLSRREIT
jgi:hypothetical protein